MALGGDHNHKVYLHASTCTPLHSCRNGRLVHHEMIPEGEEWWKLGGDKGGGSFKMSFQLGGISKPNSVHNTCVFTIFNASDTPTNLHIALARYKDRVSDLKTLQWRYAILTGSCTCTHNQLQSAYLCIGGRISESSCLETTNCLVTSMA